jgi:hypothetical protein
MNNEIKDIVSRLERQGKAIERAIAALRELDGQADSVKAVAAPAAPTAVAASAKSKTPSRKGNLTEDGRRRISEALKARWAAKKAGSAVGKKRGLRKVA